MTFYPQKHPYSSFENNLGQKDRRTDTYLFKKCVAASKNLRIFPHEARKVGTYLPTFFAAILIAGQVSDPMKCAVPSDYNPEQYMFLASYCGKNLEGEERLWIVTSEEVIVWRNSAAIRRIHRCVFLSFQEMERMARHSVSCPCYSWSKLSWLTFLTFFATVWPSQQSVLSWKRQRYVLTSHYWLDHLTFNTVKIFQNMNLWARQSVQTTDASVFLFKIQLQLNPAIAHPHLTNFAV